MTFDDFKQLCEQVAFTNLPVQQPCPIVVGEGQDRAYLSDTLDHHIVIFKTVTDAPALQLIYSKVRFTFNETLNQTVIQPLTTGT